MTYRWLLFKHIGAVSTLREDGARSVHFRETVALFAGVLIPT